MKEEVICLSSGGLDSSIMLFNLTKQGYSVIPLFFDYGHKCRKREIEALKKVIIFTEKKFNVKIPEIKIIKLNLFIDSVRFNYTPQRNLIFSSIAVNYAISKGITKVFGGFVDASKKEMKNNAYILDDGGIKFVKMFNILNKYTLNDKVKLFGFNQYKDTYVRNARKDGFDFSLIWFCYDNKKEPCGVCRACENRKEFIKKEVK